MPRPSTACSRRLQRKGGRHVAAPAHQPETAPRLYAVPHPDCLLLRNMTKKRPAKRGERTFSSARAVASRSGGSGVDPLRAKKSASHPPFRSSRRRLARKLEDCSRNPKKALRALPTGKSVAGGLGDPQWLARDADQDNHHAGLAQDSPVPDDPLIEHQAGGADLRHARLDFDDVVDARWPQELEAHATHDECGRLAPAGARNQGPVVIAEQAQEVRTSALAPAHVARVVDEAGEIRVL